MTNLFTILGMAVKVLYASLILDPALNPRIIKVRQELHLPKEQHGFYQKAKLS
jgi:hypothetical protein